MKRIVDNFHDFMIRESNRLNESLSQDMYHITKLSYIFDILKHDRIKMSISFDNNDDNFHGELYYLSLTRNRNLNLGFSSTNRFEYNSIITFDYRKLNTRYKSKAVDFYYNKKNERDIQEYEYEERILSNSPVINNISNYIKEVSLIIKPNHPLLSNLKAICRNLNVPLLLYNNATDFNKRKPYETINSVVGHSKVKIEDSRNMNVPFGNLYEAIIMNEILMKGKFDLYNDFISTIRKENYNVDVDSIGNNAIKLVVDIIYNKCENFKLDRNNSEMVASMDSFLNGEIRHYDGISFGYILHDYYEADIQEYIGRVNAKLNKLCIKKYNKKIGECSRDEVKDIFKKEEV